MDLIRKLEEKYADSSWWQFIKFNLTGYLISLIQFLLANLLPFLFDGFRVKLPVVLRGIFDAKTLFDSSGPYVVDGVVTWGYVLPFFLSNLIANIFGYFINMKTVFKGKGYSWSLPLYCLILVCLILVSTWLQGVIVSLLMGGKLSFLARTLAMMASGLFQVAVLFPLEKYVLFR